MDQLQVYATAELLLSIHISVSNLLVLWVYIRNRSVRTVTNTYIFSLALTDFLVGAIGIPVTVFSVLTRWPYEYMSCLTVHLILCILCTISTFHMLAIALDKYVTICCRDRVFQTRHSRAVFLIASSWLFGTLIACLPLFGAFNFQNTASLFSGECHFTNVVDYRYLVYVIFFATILAPTAVIIFCYASIYRRIRQDESQVKCLLRQSEREKRMLGRRKLIRILLILVFTYAVCWYPLYIINTIDFFVPQWSIARFTLLTVVVSHFSCALNPLIYAYGMPGYKKALRSIFSRRAMDHMNTTCNYSGYVRSSVPKQNRSFTLRSRLSRCTVSTTLSGIGPRSTRSSTATEHTKGERPGSVSIAPARPPLTFKPSRLSLTAPPTSQERPKQRTPSLPPSARELPPSTPAHRTSLQKTDHRRRLDRALSAYFPRAVALDPVSPCKDRRHTPFSHVQVIPILTPDVCPSILPPSPHLKRMMSSKEEPEAIHISEVILEPAPLAEQEESSSHSSHSSHTSLSELIVTTTTSLSASPNLARC